MMNYFVFFITNKYLPFYFNVSFISRAKINPTQPFLVQFFSSSNHCDLKHSPIAWIQKSWFGHKLRNMRRKKPKPSTSHLSINYLMRPWQSNRNKLAKCCPTCPWYWTILLVERQHFWHRNWFYSDHVFRHRSFHWLLWFQFRRTLKIKR